MTSEVKDEKEPICTIRNFVNAKGKGISNGGFSYHSIDSEKDCERDAKYQNGTIVRNGGQLLQNGGKSISNRTANGTLSNGTILNGSAVGTLFKHHGSYEKFDDTKNKDEDSIELDFSTSSFMQSESDAVVECSKNKS